MKELILNADDFGLTRGVNEGIICAHREGILTSTTLMANGPAFDDAVERAGANPKLGIGCHVVLVGGRAVAPPKEIPSLVNPAGYLPDSLGAFVARLSLGMIVVKEIEREIRAQIERIRTAGIEPTHLDTHKHTHVHPRVMEALGRVAQELGVTRVRKPFETLRDSWEACREDGSIFSKQLVAAAAVRATSRCFATLARRFGLRSPDYFLGLAMTGKLEAASLQRLIERLSDGRTEIMLHPGKCDDELRQTGTRLREERQRELDGLLDAEVESAVTQNGVRLISYRELN
jgi:hopanoid biosynthesis associated protein HpnK